MKFFYCSAFCFIVLLVFGYGLTFAQPTYIGSDQCMLCHNNVNTNLGYNIWEEYLKSGHPFKLNEVTGAPPVYPANSSPGVPLTPMGTDWSDFSYVIGGYGWKARWVKTDGFIFTANDSAQYNLENSSWDEYHPGESRPYNYGCFKCHTTAPVDTGSWNGVPSDSLGNFGEPGIRCEGCHGPGSEHFATTGATPPPIQGDSLRFTNCGNCHNRDSKTNAIPVSGKYIRHHEQFNEMKASKHGDGNGPDLTCASCHDPHIAIRYPAAAGPGLSAIKTECATCHPNHDILLNGSPKQNITCEDCHMAQASKSAIGMQSGNGWRGDVATHIWSINTKAETRDSMFTTDGKFVKLDQNGIGHVTLDFVCLNCHPSQTVEWAASFAAGIHENGIVGIEAGNTSEIPDRIELLANYPNPFNPSTKIEYSLPTSSRVLMTVYNTIGQKVATLVNEVQPAGSHKVEFQATDLPSGIYIYRLETEKESFSRKMVLMK